MLTGVHVFASIFRVDHDLLTKKNEMAIVVQFLGHPVGQTDWSC